METINSGVDSYQKIQSLFQGISGQINTVTKPSSENLEAIKLIRSLNDEKKMIFIPRLLSMNYSI